jgi:nicotinamidase-related amidase
MESLCGICKRRYRAFVNDPRHPVTRCGLDRGHHVGLDRQFHLSASKSFSQGSAIMTVELSKYLRPGRVAVLLSEVQRAIIGDLGGGRPIAQVANEVGVIANSARLADAARRHQAPVVHCLANTGRDRFGSNSNARLFMGAGRAKEVGEYRHNPAGDTPCPEVWCDGDVLSPRDHGLHPMADNQLDTRLRNYGVDTVIIAGVSLNVAITGMTIEAVNRSYRVIIARDAVSGFPADYGPAVLKNTLSFLATLATVDEIIAAWSVA